MWSLTWGLRDRALIATMAYTSARVGAVITMKGEDYFRQGKRWWFRLHEVPTHHKAEAHVDAWKYAERMFAGFVKWNL